MKALWLSAALLVVGGAAQAAEQSYSFEIDGRTVRIERPTDCTELSCLSISIPGIYESRPRRGTRRDEAAPSPQPKTAAPPAAAAQPAPKPDSVPPVAAPPRATAAAPSETPAASPAPAAAPVASDAASQQTATPVAPAATTPPPAATPAVSEPPKPAAVAVAPAAPASDGTAAAARPANDSPVGLWVTEKKEGRVRIEPCGSNLCGYEVDARTDANGRKVLIDMKASGDKWAGRIHDPKSGGNYDSTIALRGADELRVQGCAFGGMFCGGQTWTRID